MKKVLVITLVSLFVVAGSAMALPFNTRQVGSVSDFATGAGSEDGLQEVFDTAITTGHLNAYGDQSDVALWQKAEGQIDAYMISMFTAADGVLGIYSASTGMEVDLASFGAPADPNGGGIGSGPISVGFEVTDSGYLFVDGVSMGLFGETFGFYWKANNSTFYTEDDKNDGGKARSLNYVLDEGMVVDRNAYGVLGAVGSTSFTAQGNNDWLLAWEDWTDNDFNDAIFLVEDMNPVPEPGMILLFGAGLVALFGLGRKRIKK